MRRTQCSSSRLWLSSHASLLFRANICNSSKLTVSLNVRSSWIFCSRGNRKVKYRTSAGLSITSMNNLAGVLGDQGKHDSGAWYDSLTRRSRPSLVSPEARTDVPDRGQGRGVARSRARQVGSDGLSEVAIAQRMPDAAEFCLAFRGMIPAWTLTSPGSQLDKVLR
jgi:hypothetical protein